MRVDRAWVWLQVTVPPDWRGVVAQGAGGQVVAVSVQRGVRVGEQACHTGKILESYHRLADTELH